MGTMWKVPKRERIYEETYILADDLPAHWGVASEDVKKAVKAGSFGYDATLPDGRVLLLVHTADWYRALWNNDPALFHEWAAFEQDVHKRADVAFPTATTVGVTEWGDRCDFINAERKRFAAEHGTTAHA